MEMANSTPVREAGPQGWAPVPHHRYPLLVVEDGLHPLEVHGLEGHQHQQGVGVVLRPGVEVGRLGVEEAHGGLGAHVLLIAVDRGVVQPWEEEEEGGGVKAARSRQRGGLSGARRYLITTS